MDDFYCPRRRFIYSGTGKLPMGANLSLPIDRLANPSRPSQLAALVRRILAENAGKLEQAITAGALTVSVAPEDHAIEIRDRDSGRVRFLIGGAARISEIVPFVIDWKKRILEMRLSEMETDESSEEISSKPFTAPSKKLRIICAEDSPDDQERLFELLSERGHSVTCCDNGQAALQEITRASYDVLVTDNNMPRMGGMELIRALQNARSIPRIIVTSAFLEPEKEEQYRNLGVSLFLPKPSPSEKIVQAVEGD
ncbi:MAG: response regulator [Terrimicrobiaceae bacterium]|nr:response regulator [Terrimicrobiaceae bacterium]